jgi:hypothetical protein
VVKISNATAPQIQSRAKKTAKSAARIGANFILKTRLRERFPMKRALLVLGGTAVAVIALFIGLHPRGVRASTPSISCGLVCVTTHAYDNNQDNVNSSETAFLATNQTQFQNLTATNIHNLHGIIYAQPLYLPDVPYEPNADTLYVATEENWVYALNAANLSGIPIWVYNLNSLVSGDTPVPDDLLSGGPPGCPNIVGGETGITGTPVIDIGANSTQPNVLYAVSSHYNANANPSITQDLNAINVLTGSVTAWVDIASKINNPLFLAGYENQRAALAISYDANNNPLIYVAWASHCDETPYQGWVAVFTLTGSTNPTLSLVASYNTTGGVSTAMQGGIWMGGGGPAVDASTGYVYLSTGNGTVTVNSNNPNQYEYSGITNNGLGDIQERIIKGTLGSTKRGQIGTDQLGV